MVNVMLAVVQGNTSAFSVDMISALVVMGQESAEDVKAQGMPGIKKVEAVGTVMVVLTSPVTGEKKTISKNNQGGKDGL